MTYFLIAAIVGAVVFVVTPCLVRDLHHYDSCLETARRFEARDWLMTLALAVVSGLAWPVTILYCAALAWMHWRNADV